MSDVSYSKRKANAELDDHHWSAAFRSSRWFTRGWTLQESLAPTSVDFFSKEWRRLGDKVSLQTKIRQATRIPTSVLQGEPLSKLTIDDRLKWGEHRNTKLPEDRAYCLIGILGVQMTPFYGEGAAGAFKRLMEEAYTQRRFFQDLRLSDPHDDKRRIEERRGGLLEETRLLWIKGDAGKGKAMLLCGIVNELQRSTAMSHSFFFCQGTDHSMNNTTSVLRGLIYMLVSQRPWLASYLRKKYDQAGGALFEGANTWVALSDVFADMTHDTDLNTSWLLVDAVDECVTDLPKLLDLIVRTTTSTSRVKWLISSRNEAHIEQRLISIGQAVKLSLELEHNAKQVARAANGTFLWVALMMQELERPGSWDPLAMVQEAPEGLDQLYDSMMDRIVRLTKREADMCRLLLCTAATAYRPLYLAEIGSLCGLATGRKMVLVDAVTMISAKDYISGKMLGAALPSQWEMNHDLFMRSLELMSETLTRDMYGLVEPGYPIDEVETSDTDPLTAVRYSCIHWVDHLCDCSISDATSQDENLRDDGAVHMFLEKCYVYWLEALRLCRSMSAGVFSVSKLATLIQDARRFILYHKTVIEKHPLQVYASALVFSPPDSLIRRSFEHEELTGLSVRPCMQRAWSACLQTLEGHISYVRSVNFSHDSTLLASASHDGTVKIWQVISNECVQTLEGHGHGGFSVVFSHDSSLLASASADRTVKVWQAGSNNCVRILEGHSNTIRSVDFSHDSTLLASASDDCTVKVWHVGSGRCVLTLEGHSHSVMSVVFSHDSSLLASASEDSTVKVWQVGSNKCVQTLEGHSSFVDSVAFSHDSTLDTASLSVTLPHSQGVVGGQRRVCANLRR
ncbi:Vegetative incompatibility protein HET-E-1-like protein 15 [Paraphaeosphaeria minitans]|uniref:Vegetative incompatibility protein HET-E-1-like protein 15 n=1 Tax=Paraphaeosphaeria minitans TaxID=565426 RepID=A0A9P6KJP9_9PLEO|nr:Vegetative incompatibility protein HET-E-1-like protein 15 [Paraphaeosphaeria minitans]